MSYEIENHINQLLVPFSIACGLFATLLCDLTTILSFTHTERALETRRRERSIKYDALSRMRVLALALLLPVPDLFPATSPAPDRAEVKPPSLSAYTHSSRGIPRSGIPRPALWSVYRTSKLKMMRHISPPPSPLPALGTPELYKYENRRARAWRKVDCPVPFVS